LPPPKAYQPLNHKDKMAALGLLQSSAHLHYGGMGVGLEDYMKGLPKERWHESYIHDNRDGYEPLDGAAIAALYTSGMLDNINSPITPVAESPSPAQRPPTPPPNKEISSLQGSFRRRRVSKNTELDTIQEPDEF